VIEDTGVGLLVAGIVAAAGIMRGITGFGGAMLMTPPLGILLGPASAVAISLSLEAVAALVMVPAVYKDLPIKQVTLLIVPACIAIPFGTKVLIGLDPTLARQIIAGVVVLSSLAMLLGVRYTRETAGGVSVGVGALSGVPTGATGIGGPPVILFLLSGPSPVRNARAILTVFISVTALVGVVALLVGGAIAVGLLIWSAVLALGYLAAVWIGMKAFARLSDGGVRTIALSLMLAVGVAALVV
jgi:uncharacterized membrane protein YfcA